MAAQSIEKFAASIRVPVERLLRQLQEAGVGERSAADSITDDEKAQLLGFLRRSHGAEATDASPTPRKITLTRQVVSELKQPAVARRAGPGAAPATPAMPTRNPRRDTSWLRDVTSTPPGRTIHGG